MKILMCSSEVAPFAKTGGLADVLAALPPELEALGHDVRVIMPLHGMVNRQKHELEWLLGPLGVPVGAHEQWCSVHQATLPHSDVPVYFIEHDRYFSRPTLYQWDGEDYNDNAERFAFFSRACLQLAKALHFEPDIVHCHDWQSALTPVYLKTFDSDDVFLQNAASVLTIHNIGYQGVFPKDQIVHSQLGWERFTPDGLEFYGKINYLKIGILYSDKVTTVSPTHAAEIQTAEHGWALDGVLRARSPDLVGVLNGCDYREWDPMHDRLIPAPFDADDLEGKAKCKRELQKLFHLEQRDDVPIVGLVSRLVYQKGIDVLATALPRILDLEMQLATLGAGEIWSHFLFGDLPNRYPGKAGSFIGYDNERAHLVMAGSDFLLIPSRYEPCGLTQLAAKRYGTLPIVRSTGGLADTVANYDEVTGEGDGFKFYDLTPEAIANTVGWAAQTYAERPDHIEKMRRRAMADRHQWSESAEKYLQIYQWACERKRGP